MKTTIGLLLLLPVMLGDCVIWIFGGWTKGGLDEMPLSQYIWSNFIQP